MPKLIDSFKQYFSKHATSKTVHIIILILSLLIIAILTPFSIIESDKSQNNCKIDPIIYITKNQSSIYSNFTSFIANTKKSLDISFSIPKEVIELPKYWKDTFAYLHKNHVSIRVFTDNSNLKFDQYVKIRYLKKSKDKESFSFNMNFAVSDGVNIFFPSVFFINEIQKSDEDQATFSYIAQLNGCELAGKDLLALFNILWTEKSQSRKTSKHSFLPKNLTTNFSFIVEPISEFSVGLTNITSTLYEFMSLSYLNKFIITHSVFPNLQKIASKQLEIDISHKSALTSSLFEVAEEIVQDQETYLMISLHQFNKHKAKFLSMISNMINNSVSVCNNTRFQGTIIASSSPKVSKLFLLPSGISNIFTGDMVLGLSIDVKPQIFDSVSALFLNNTRCEILSCPTVSM